MRLQARGRPDCHRQAQVVLAASRAHQRAGPLHLVPALLFPSHPGGGYSVMKRAAPSLRDPASRPRSESKECRFAAPPWFTRAGEVGQLNQADSSSQLFRTNPYFVLKYFEPSALHSLRSLSRSSYESKQSQFLLAANKRHVLLRSSFQAQASHDLNDIARIRKYGV